MSENEPSESLIPAEPHPAIKQTIEAIKKPSKEQIMTLIPASLAALFSFFFGLADAKGILVVLLTIITTLGLYVLLALSAPRSW